MIQYMKGSDHMSLSKNIKKLAQSEREIMNAIWENDTPVCVNDLFTLLGDSEWKYTTVATFLTRLEKKGFLKREKRGERNYYSAAISYEEYLSSQTDEFIADMYGGAATEFIAGFCKNRISQKDYEELMNILKKYE